MEYFRPSQKKMLSNNFLTKLFFHAPIVTKNKTHVATREEKTLYPKVYEGTGKYPREIYYLKNQLLFW